MFSLIRAALAATAVLLAVSSSALARNADAEWILRAALGRCGSPCVIKSNPGGSVDLFQAAAEAVLGGARELVVIDGPCASACAIFADIAREKICITQRASFQFHKASVLEVSRRADGSRQVELVDREDPPQSPDILEWVAGHGGFPTKGLTVMTSRQARAFWRVCSPGELASN